MPTIIAHTSVQPPAPSLTVWMKFPKLTSTIFARKYENGGVWGGGGGGGGGGGN